MLKIKIEADNVREKTRRHQQLGILNRRINCHRMKREELLKLEAGRRGNDFDGILRILLPEPISFTLKTIILSGRDRQSVLTRSKEGEAHVQIDNVVLAKDFLYTFEIKNYSFDLSYKTPWYFENGNEFSDPLVQVTKQRNKMSRLLGSFTHQIRMFNVLVFINENQTIYNLPQPMKSSSEAICAENYPRRW